MKNQQQNVTKDQKKRELTAEEIKMVSGAGRWGGGALSLSYNSMGGSAGSSYSMNGRWGGGEY